MSASPHTGLESSRCNQWIQTSYISKKKDKKDLPYGQSVYGLRASLSSFFAILNVFQFWETSLPKRNWICGSVFFTSGVTIPKISFVFRQEPDCIAVDLYLALVTAYPRERNSVLIKLSHTASSESQYFDFLWCKRLERKHLLPGRFWALFCQAR